MDGRRLTRLRYEDLPNVARAITGYERRLVHVEQNTTHPVGFYRFTARAFNVVVLVSDFALILPYLQDGTFDPLQFPVPRVVGLNTVAHDIGTIDQWDPLLYGRVYDQLQVLFPDRYPTSNL